METTGLYIFFSLSGSVCVFSCCNHLANQASNNSIKRKVCSFDDQWLCSTRGHSTRFYWWVFDGKTLDGGGRIQVDGKGGLIRKLRGWIGPSVQSPIDLSGRKCHTVAHYRSTQLNCMRNKWLPLLLNCPRKSYQKISLIWKIQPFLHGFSFPLVPDLSLRTLLLSWSSSSAKKVIDRLGFRTESIRRFDICRRLMHRPSGLAIKSRCPVTGKGQKAVRHISLDWFAPLLGLKCTKGKQMREFPL